jgi:hypothetical protein
MVVVRVRKPIFYLVLTSAVLLALPARAQVITSKRAPESMPQVLSSASIHSTAPSRLVPPVDGGREVTGLGALIGQRGSSALAGDAALGSAMPGLCAADSLVCYDYRRGQPVVPVMRALMPEVPGLKREGIVLKRDKVSLNYSF